MTIRGDFRRVAELSSGAAVTDTVTPADTSDFGTVMHLHGVIAHGPTAEGYLTRIFGNADVDQIFFDQTFLGGRAGSATSPIPGGQNQAIPDGGFGVARLISDYSGGKARAFGSDTPTVTLDVKATLTFTPDAANGDTITRSSGDWAADGFAAGDVITVADSLHNDRTYTIVGVSAFTLTLNVKGFVTSEAATTNVRVKTNKTAATGDGEDFFVVDRLQSMVVDRNGNGDTLTLDGQAGTDYYSVQTSGSQGDLRNYVINVLDTGKKDDGVDELLIMGADSAPSQPGSYDDFFLLRGMDAIPGEASESPAFVGLLHVAALAQAQAGTGPSDVERINYDANLNGRLIVEGKGGNDYFAVDDNSAITTLDGGAGDDNFQIGQIFGSQRNAAANIASTDIFGTVATTRGYLSRGTSAPLVAEGGSGDDVFTVYSNQAALRLEGDDGDDLFIVRAFALAETNPDGTIKTDANGVAIVKTSGGVSTAAEDILKGGAGNDFIEYNINAPVSVDGGAGFDKLLVLGTEFGDNFVITDQGVFGAGLNVTYANVEVVEVDGLEGDDHFTVLSTPSGVATELVGGLGNDTFNVASDVTDVITTQELEGQSAIINHEASAIADPGYDGLIVPGIDLNVAGPPGDSGSGSIFSGNVIIEELDGTSLVRETASGDWGTVDSYTVRLAVKPAEGTTVYVTVSAARSPQEEADDAGHGNSVLVSTDQTTFVRDVVENGVPPTTVRNRAVVLVFDSSNWDQPQTHTVYVAAANNSQEEGKRVVAVSHTVQAVITDGTADTIAAQTATLAAYNGIKVDNVLVTVIDNDSAGILLTELRKDQYDNGTLVLGGAGPPGITDQYTVELTKAPTSNVTVHLSYDTTQLILSQSDITFTPGNWDQPVTITVSAVDDTLREDRKLSLITHSVSSSADPAYFSAGKSTVSETLAVTVVDDDVPGVLVQQSNGSTLVSGGVTILTL